MATRYWIAALPVQSSASSLWSNLQEFISKRAFDTPLYRVIDPPLSHFSIGWETTSDGLRAAFARYGEIEDCRVVADKATGRSKGYGFLLFRHRHSTRLALRQPQKLIDNRMTACQLASTGPPSAASHPAPPHHHTASSNPNPGSAPQDNLPRKIYVGNVHSNIDGARLHAFFSKYGEIEEGQQAVAPSAAPQTAPAQNYGMGNMGYQNAGFQGPPGFQGPAGFQGPPGFQGTQAMSQQSVGGGGGSYQGGSVGQGSIPRPPVGHMGGYAQH